MLLSIIVVSYNTQDLTLACLRSVAESIKSSTKLANQTEVFVVDNHSQDQSVAAVKSWFNNLTQPRFKLSVITNSKNQGFAFANNQAIKKASGEYILLLNSDTKLELLALEKLIKTFISHPDVTHSAYLPSSPAFDRLGVVAANLVNPDGSLQPQGGDLPSLLSVASHFLFLDEIPLLGRFLPSTQHTGRSPRQRSLTGAKDLVHQSWVGATAMLVKKSAFDEVGLLDENIFMYGEDVEFCERMRNHHYDVVVQTQAKVIHYGQASSGSKNALWGEIRGLVYFFSKHRPLWQLGPLKLILKLGVALRKVIFARIVSNHTLAKIYQEIGADIKSL